MNKRTEEPATAVQKKVLSRLLNVKKAKGLSLGSDRLLPHSKENSYLRMSTLQLYNLFTS